MDYTPLVSEEKLKYLKLLAEKYKTEAAVSREIINLKAILNLPKGTEHFMSDLHGEYEVFYHILNNSAGVIKEKVDLIFEDRLTAAGRQELCTLIYYPKEKLKLLQSQNKLNNRWYKNTLQELIELAKLVSSKYTRSKVRKALPEDFSYIIDELMHAQTDEDNNQSVYHEKIMETIIDIGSADAFIEALSNMIKRLAVDHLHIVGDIFDRGPRADKIIELLMDYHSLDIQWGNHDILWMGAACGNMACIATVLKNNIKYKNIEILENSYGISLRSLTLFAENLYPKLPAMEAAYKTILVILLKLEGSLILKHPEYAMNDRLIFTDIDFNEGTVLIEGKKYQMNETHFPTVVSENPYELSAEEAKIMEDLRLAFMNSQVLQKHIAFLYEKGNIYKTYNGNLLFHGCIPMDEEGNFTGIVVNGKELKGKEYLDYAERHARLAFYDKNQDSIDFMWFLWCGALSPLSGRKVRTFERSFIDDKSVWVEDKNPYYTLYQNENICIKILHEFGLYAANAHIINGHTPIKVSEGESPVKANNRLIVIDGGFCKAYQKTTGIAGYTLIYNSHGMRLKAHKPFESIEKVLLENQDLESTSNLFELEPERVMIKDTDNGVKLKEDIKDLEILLVAMRQGLIF